MIQGSVMFFFKKNKKSKEKKILLKYSDKIEAIFIPKIIIINLSVYQKKSL